MGSHTILKYARADIFAGASPVRLCTFLARGDLEPKVGAIVAGEKVLELAKWLVTSGTFRTQSRIMTMFDLLHLGDDILMRLRDATARIDVNDATPFIRALSSVRLLAPVPRPPKILAAIVNTSGMLGGSDVRLDHPRLDMKAPSTVIGPGDTILAPASGIRPEVELAVVVGRPISRGSLKEAEQAIFGYTILNDVTAPKDSREDAYEAYRRDPATGVVARVKVRGPLFRSKNHDTFTPLGPWLVTGDELGTPNSLRMLTRFNGEIIQEGNTSEYIFGAGEILSYASRFLTLEPGDVLSLGSIGWKPATLKAHDPSEWILPSLEGVLDLEIDGIGRLRNPVRQEEVD